MEIKTKENEGNVSSSNHSPIQSSEYSPKSESLTLSSTPTPPPSTPTAKQTKDNQGRRNSFGFYTKNVLKNNTSLNKECSF